jgi:hypothetical protein
LATAAPERTSVSDPTQPPISRAVLEDRWTTATIAPWRPGSGSKLGNRLQMTLEELVQRVAMIDDDDRQLNPYMLLVEELTEIIRVELIRRMDDRGIARTGWEQISDPPAPVR